MQIEEDLLPGSFNEQATPGPSVLADSYAAVRQFTGRLCKPLEIEDYVIQTMPDVSPTKWHLAHTTWFFETFVLREHAADYRLLHTAYPYLFNSYYVQAGERYYRPERGLLSRPTVRDVFDYRAYVDEHMGRLLASIPEERSHEIGRLVRIGLNHEQQHQELLLTDVKHVLAKNPLQPVYSEGLVGHSALPPSLQWAPFEGGLCEFGYEGDGFFYDNEGPRHRQYTEPFEMASRLVTNREYMEFIEAGGYANPNIWLSEGWATAERDGWQAPLYWEQVNGTWFSFTLSGFREVDPDEPVTHVSYFEADAFARWADARLPTEFEWELAADGCTIQGNFVETGHFHPVPAAHREEPLHQVFGDVWEWTRSPYSPYPGYLPEPGALGEYNGKFMCNQFVLRGGSCATSRSHVRSTYRNFFHPAARWQFSGIRLARDV